MERPGEATSAPGRPPRARAVGPALVALAAALLALATVALVLVLVGPFEPSWVPVLFVAMGAVYAAAGLIAWWRRPANRMGLLLTLAGLIALLAALELSGVPELAAIGRVLAGVPIAVTLHLLLAFPSGRLVTWQARALVIAGYVYCLLLEAPKYLLAPEPSGLLQVADRPGLLSAAVWVQRAFGGAALLLTCVELARRLRRATPLQRRTLTPLMILGIGVILFVTISPEVMIRVLGIDPIATATAQLVALAVLAPAFVVALLGPGFGRAGELEELGGRLAANDGGAAGLRRALAEALGDPSVDLLFWAPGAGTYLDAAGAGVARGAPDGRRSRVEVDLNGRRVGAIEYDAELIGDAGPVLAAASVVAIALDRERLIADLQASGSAVRESRARVAEAADDERRRIARDLHDGLQARVLGLRMQLSSATAEASLPDATRERLESVCTGLDEAVHELRGLVQGLVPAPLVERGLVAAVEDLVDRVPIPTRLELPAGEQELQPLVETTAYFVVAEGLANALKHSGASELSVRLDRVGPLLTIEVGDNGVGGACGDGSGGIRGITDRLEAVGGRLMVTSPAGGGTRLEAQLPCAS